jgi:hypothetical protein
MDAISMWRRLSALLGAVLFAAGGATMGSRNAGWFGLERDANALFPLLGGRRRPRRRRICSQ